MKHKLQINEGLLKLIPMLFSNSPKTIMAELLQNSRRAGATRVYVSSDPGALTISVTDNGCGMGEDELRTLMSLTGSSWSESVMQEMPAGMGFLSLSSRGEVTVNTWRDGVCLSMCLHPEHFTGAEIEVTSTPTTSEGSGTTVTFSVKDAAERNDFRLEAERLLAYCGIAEPFMDDRPVATKDYIRDCQTVEVFEELGVRIGIEGGANSICGHPGISWIGVNFYGLQFNNSTTRDGSVCMLVSKEAKEAALRIRIDVLNAKVVKLVLPARNELWRGDYSELHRAVDKTIAKFAAEHAHCMPYDAYSYYKTIETNVREAGLDLCKCYAQSDMHDNLADGLKLVILASEDPNAIFHAIKAGLCAVRFDKVYHKYSWYASIPHVDVRVRADRREVRSGLAKADNITVEYTDKAGVVVAITDVDLYISEQNADSDHYYEYPKSYFDGGVELLIRSDIALSIELVGRAEDLAHALLFAVSDDSDSDSYETQNSNFCKAAEEYFERLIIDANEVVSSYFVSAMTRAVDATPSQIDAFYSLTATKRIGGKIEVEFKKAETAFVTLPQHETDEKCIKLERGDPPEDVRHILDSLDVGGKDELTIAAELEAVGLKCLTSWRGIEFTWPGAAVTPV